MGISRGTASLLFLLSLVFASVFDPQSVKAEDEVLCAAVLPCDEDGSVMPPYDRGACASYYRELCTQYAIEQLGDRVAVCTVEKGDLEKQNRRLRRQLRAVKNRG